MTLSASSETIISHTPFEEMMTHAEHSTISIAMPSKPPFLKQETKILMRSGLPAHGFVSQTR